MTDKPRVAPPRHGNEKQEKRRRLGERCEVIAYVAPQRITEIAAERTDGMLHYFVFAGRGSQFYVEDLRTLVRSAYMQGVNDILDVVRSGKVEELANAG